MEYQPIPDEVAIHLERLYEKGWPSFVEFPNATGGKLWINLERASIAQLEQAIELEKRRAVKLIKKYMRNGGGKSTAKNAACCINRARAFADWSLQIQGQEFSEEKMPFPFMTKEQMEESQRREREE